MGSIFGDKGSGYSPSNGGFEGRRRKDRLLSDAKKLAGFENGKEKEVEFVFDEGRGIRISTELLEMIEIQRIRALLLRWSGKEKPVPMCIQQTRSWNFEHSFMTWMVCRLFIGDYLNRCVEQRKNLRITEHISRIERHEVNNFIYVAYAQLNRNASL